MNITAQTSPNIGKCTCFVGYEGEHCTHGPFSIPLRPGVQTVGQARCSVQQGTSCPTNAAQNEAGWHDKGKVCTAPGCEQPARSYKVTPSSTLPPRPPVRTVSYFSYNYKNPCTDITITVTAKDSLIKAAETPSPPAPFSGRTAFSWRMNTPNATFDQFSTLARNQPTVMSTVQFDQQNCAEYEGCGSSGLALVQTMTISHRDPDLKIGQIDIAVFCDDGPLDCPVDFLIKVEESVPQAVPREMEANVPSSEMDISWYEICIPDASHGLEVEAYLKLNVLDTVNSLASWLSAKEHIPFVISPTLPTSLYGDTPPRTGDVTNLKQLNVINAWGEPTREFLEDWKFNWNAMWANYDYTKKQIRGKIKFCGDEPGFKSGPLFVGILGPSCKTSSNIKAGCPGRLGTIPKNIGTVGNAKATIYATTLQWKNQACKKKVAAHIRAATHTHHLNAFMV